MTGGLRRRRARLRALLVAEQGVDASWVAAALRDAAEEVELLRADDEESLHRALEQAPDVVLGGFGVSDLDTSRVLELIRTAGSDVPLLVLTGDASHEEAVRSLRAGAVDYLSRDQLGRLSRAVTSAMASRAARREREQVVDDLRASEARYRRVFLDNPTGIFLSTVGGRLLECNAAFAEILGFDSVEEAKNADLTRFYPDPESRQALLDRVRAGEPIHLHEHTVLDRHGKPLHVVESALGIFDDQGALTQIMGHVVDVSRHREAERERNLLSTAIEASAETVVITDREGVIQYVNPAFERTSGFSRDEAVGQTPRILNSGAQDAAFYEAMWTTITAGRVWTGRITNRRKDGGLYHEDVSISPVRNALTGEIENFVGIKRDVTHEMSLEAQLHETQRLESLGRLAGGVAHDFNNLLTVVKTSAHLALAELGDGRPGVAAEIEEIRAASDRAAQLTRQLLAFGRRQTFRSELLDLGEVVERTRRMLSRVIGEDVDLRVEHGEAIWPVLADRGQMEQILVNLSVNARDAMPKGGRLTLSVENVHVHDETATSHSGAMEAGHYVALSVTDTGHGMSEEVLTKAFEPFFTTKPEGRGTGLGLSTVYGIVRQSGGYVWLYSEVDRGTTVRVYLPRAGEAHISDGSAPARSEAQESLDGTETVLVVEDHPQLRAASARALARHGYRVLEAEDPEGALQVAREHDGPIHIIVSDVVLPRMRGSDLVPLLKEHHPDAAVLFMSGYAHEQFGGALPRGTAFLRKPFDLTQLARTVRRTLDERSG